MDKRRWYLDARLTIIILISVAFAAALLVSRDLGLDRADPSNRMRFHAIPVAISQIYHGRPHDYTAYWSIAMRFQRNPPLPLETAIEESISAPIPSWDKTYYWTADDRGLSDFVNIGFRLFGPTMPSLFYFWFLILGCSIACAVIRFWNDSVALSVIACTVIAIGVTLPALTRTAGDPMVETSIHLSESRMFDMLGVVAAVHLVLVMLRPATPAKWLGIGTMVAQAALIAALVHARTSVAWLFIAVLSIGLVLSCLSLKWARMRPSRAVLAVLAIVVAAWTSVPIYESMTFNVAYRGAIGPRTFWHNALMGLYPNSVLAGSVQVRRTDRSVIEAVLSDMRTRDDPRLTEEWDTNKILNSLGSFNSFDWRTYEKVARNLYLRTLLSHPWQALKLFMWDKPKAVADIISCRFLLLTCAASDFTAGNGGGQSAARLAPLIWLGLLALIVLNRYIARINSAGVESEDSSAGIILLLLIGALIGIAPSVVVYPAVTQLGGTVVLLWTALGFSTVVASEYIRDRWLHLRHEYEVR